MGSCRRTARSDRKSTRLNSSHTIISYAVFCLKKKTHDRTKTPNSPRSREYCPHNPRARRCGVAGLAVVLPTEVLGPRAMLGLPIIFFNDTAATESAILTLNDSPPI